MARYELRWKVGDDAETTEAIHIPDRVGKAYIYLHDADTGRVISNPSSKIGLTAVSTGSSQSAGMIDAESNRFLYNAYLFKSQPQDTESVTLIVTVKSSSDSVVNTLTAMVHRYQLAWYNPEDGTISAETKRTFLENDDGAYVAVKDARGSGLVPFDHTALSATVAGLLPVGRWVDAEDEPKAAKYIPAIVNPGESLDVTISLSDEDGPAANTLAAVVLPRSRHDVMATPKPVLDRGFEVDLSGEETSSEYYYPILLSMPNDTYVDLRCSITKYSTYNGLHSGNYASIDFSAATGYLAVSADNDPDNHPLTIHNISENPYTQGYKVYPIIGRVMPSSSLTKYPSPTPYVVYVLGGAKYWFHTNAIVTPLVNGGTLGCGKFAWPIESTFLMEDMYSKWEYENDFKKYTNINVYFLHTKGTALGSDIVNGQYAQSIQCDNVIGTVNSTNWHIIDKAISTNTTSQYHASVSIPNIYWDDEMGATGDLSEFEFRITYQYWVTNITSGTALIGLQPYDGGWITEETSGTYYGMIEGSWKTGAFDSNGFYTPPINVRRVEDYGVGVVTISGLTGGTGIANLSGKSYGQVYSVTGTCTEDYGRPTAFRLRTNYASGLTATMILEARKVM